MSIQVSNLHVYLQSFIELVCIIERSLSASRFSEAKLYFSLSSDRTTTTHIKRQFISGNNAYQIENATTHMKRIRELKPISEKVEELFQITARNHQLFDELLIEIIKTTGCYG